MLYNTYNFFCSEFFKLHGRYDITQFGELLLNWSNNGFEFNFFGDGFILNFGEFSSDTPAYLRVFVDGKSQRFSLARGDEKIVFDSLPNEKHNVKVLRVTEDETLITVQSITLRGKAPVMLDKPCDKQLKLEFFGDSITCGYGVMGNKTSPGYVTYEQDSTFAYAYMTSEILNADANYESISGKGLVSNCMGDRTDIKISEFYAYKTRRRDKWDFSIYTPDAVIINAGTNDAWGGITRDEFYNAAVLFLKNIRAAYSTAKILWAYGIMDESIIDAVERAVNDFNRSDGKTFFVYIPSMGRFQDEVGGGGHPNTVTSERASKILAEKLKQIL
ncbi:MAG: GDSL-type esterase/lipase family protein [Clostridia bacterium]